MTAQEEVTPIEVVDLEEDSAMFSIFCRGSNKRDAISVEQYAEQRDISRAIMTSILPYSESLIDLDDYDDEVLVLNITPWTSRPKQRKPPEAGQSSNSKPFVCEICVEPKPMNESFSIQGCLHSYCTDCMTKYVASKLQENITSIGCPVSNCEGKLQPEYCRRILPQEVFDRWGNALCESLILGSEKFYCPFKDCSALLINDGNDEVITQTECPNCRRLFCAQCKVAWHLGIECREFQNLHKDEKEKEDILMMKLAQEKMWKRCPKCRFYVEKSIGCMYMKCRCGFAFCYHCGAPSATNSHICSSCGH